MMTSKVQKNHTTDVHFTSVLTGFVQIRFQMTTWEGPSQHAQVEMI